MSSIDLHIHSNFSNDAQFTPSALVDMCLEKGIKAFAIADHNSGRGLAETIAYCRDKPIDFIPCVELDCEFNGIIFHLLGYGIDPYNAMIDALETDIIQQEQSASIERMRLIRSLGIDFEDSVIQSLAINGVVEGEMIAEAAMLYDQEHKHPLLQPYYPGGERSDNPFVNFYWDYCAQGKAGYAKVDYISLQTAIQIIKTDRGVPVLAHPGLQVKENEGLLKEIIACGIQGIEVYSSYHNQSQTEFYKEMADKYDCIMTCGSDFHGKSKPSIQIGGIECDGLETQIMQSLKKYV